MTENKLAWKEELERFIPDGMPGKNLYRVDLIAFISKVEQDAYKRGVADEQKCLTDFPDEHAEIFKEGEQQIRKAERQRIEYGIMKEIEKQEIWKTKDIKSLLAKLLS